MTGRRANPRWRRLRGLFIKESIQIVRDPSTLMIAFVLPLLLMFLFGYAVSLDTTQTRVGLAVQDEGAAAQSLAGAYRSSKWFETTASRSVAPLKDDLVAGRIRAIIVIPADFSRRFASGSAQVQVITDGSLPNTAGLVAGYAEGVRATWEAGQLAERGRQTRPAIALAERFWFNPELASRYFLVPGAIAIVMAMIGTLLTALVIAREWERGTMEALLATPVTMVELIISKIVPYFLLGLVSMTLCTLAAIIIFGVPFRGSPLAMLAISAAFLVPALGQGLLISALVKNQFVAAQIALVTGFLPVMMLSGFIFEISSMPLPHQILTYLVPARYLVPPLQTVFMAGDVWPLFLTHIGALLAFGALFFIIALRNTKRRVA